jgi:hypothetical protein
MTLENRDILGQLAIIGVVVAGLAIYATVYDAWDIWVMPIQKQLQSIEDKIDDLRER